MKYYKFHLSIPLISQNIAEFILLQSPCLYFLWSFRPFRIKTYGNFPITSFLVVCCTGSFDSFSWQPVSVLVRIAFFWIVIINIVYNIWCSCYFKLVFLEREITNISPINTILISNLLHVISSSYWKNLSNEYLVLAASKF